MYCRSVYSCQLRKLPEEISVFCESELCPSRAEDLRRHSGSRFSDPAAADGTAAYPSSSSSSSSSSSVCAPVVGPGSRLPSACVFPWLQHQSLLVSCWFCVISQFPFSPGYLSFCWLPSSLRAVINGFDIRLSSSLPLSGSLKCSPWNHLPTSLRFGRCPAAEHALLSRTFILPTCNME